MRVFVISLSNSSQYVCLCLCPCELGLVLLFLFLSPLSVLLFLSLKASKSFYSFFYLSTYLPSIHVTIPLGLVYHPRLHFLVIFLTFFLALPHFFLLSSKTMEFVAPEKIPAVKRKRLLMLSKSFNHSIAWLCFVFLKNLLQREKSKEKFFDEKQKF